MPDRTFMLKSRLIAAILFAVISFFVGLQSAYCEDVHTRIIDGTKTSVSNFPYVAQVTLDGELDCTGTLVGSKYVLTAAHCIFDEKNRRISNASRFGAVLNGTAYQAAAVTVNPTYVSRSEACVQNELDSAIIELTSAPVGIAAIPLVRSASPVGTQLLLVGFGTQGSGAGGENGSIPGPGFVNYGTTAIEDNDPTYVNWTFNTNSGESNTASGDSGGPAFVDDGNTRYINSITCGGTGNAGFETSSSNTRADRIAAWVDSVTGASPDNTAPSFISLPAQTAGANQPFSYLVQATGTLPLTITADALPPGLTFDGATISGVPTTVGAYTVTLTASNSVTSTPGSLVINVMPFDPNGSLAVKRVSVSFADDDSDLINIKGTIQLPKANNFRPRGQRVTITIANLRDQFKLGADGFVQRRNGFDFVELFGRISNGKFKKSSVKFEIGLGDKDSLYDKLDQIFPFEATPGATVQLPIEIMIGTVTYNATVTMVYVGNDKWRFVG